MFQLKITIDDLERPIWRRVLVPGDWSLHRLHHVIQRIFSWEDCHMHSFWIGRREYGPLDPEEDDGMIDECSVRLRDVARARSKFRYEYDFGDSWRHTIVVEKVLAPVPGARARCLAGKRAAPPEDSGGAWGYEDKLEILADPKNEDHDEIAGWLGEDFDPEAFDLDEVNTSLKVIGAPRFAHDEARRSI
jgi:hypothetical protein